MGTKRTLGAAAATLAIAGGVVTGSLIGDPRESSAQEESSTSSPVPAERDAFARGWGSKGSTDAAAEALGLEPSELSERLRDGSTIAEVAEAEGVDLDAVIDAMVAAELERLTDLEGSATERMTALANGEGFFKGGRGPRPGGEGPGRSFGGDRGPGFDHGGPGQHGGWGRPDRGDEAPDANPDPGDETPEVDEGE